MTLVPLLPPIRVKHKQVVQHDNHRCQKLEKGKHVRTLHIGQSTHTDIGKQTFIITLTQIWKGGIAGMGQSSRRKEVHSLVPVGAVNSGGSLWRVEPWQAEPNPSLARHLFQKDLSQSSQFFCSLLPPSSSFYHIFIISTVSSVCCYLCLLVLWLTVE